ncbi:MAG: hypothetical protein ABIK09_00165 [Pseudomonadota bacterium]
MRSTVRVLAFFLVLATVYWVMTHGGGILSRTIEATRKVVTMWNLRSIKDVVLASRILQEPDRILAWSEEDFSEFLRDALVTPKDDAADPTVDPWESPYLLDILEDGEDWVLVSTGPNLVPDLCDFEGPGGDDICLVIPAAEISR